MLEGAGIWCHPRFTFWLTFFQSDMVPLFVSGLLLYLNCCFIGGTSFIYNPLTAPRTKILIEKYLHIPRGKWLNYMYLQTVETLIRRRILQHLIWVCTVCQVPFYGSPDYSGLIALFCFVFKQVQYEFLISQINICALYVFVRAGEENGELWNCLLGILK